MRAVCTVASLPVMPWTMTLLSAVKKMDMGHVPFSGARELGGFVSGLVHRRYDCHQWVVGLGQDASAFIHVVAVQANHQRLVGVVAEDLQSLHDPIGHGVTRGYATEHVDEHALDLCVTQDDVETGGHHLGGSTTTDVEEVGRLDPAVLLAR